MFHDRNSADIEVFSILLKIKTESEISSDEICKCLRFFEHEAFNSCGLYCDGTINWTHPAYAAMLAMAKDSEIWALLSDEVKIRLSLTAACMMVMASFMTNDGNDYRTGFGLQGNVYKGYNPNIQMSLVGTVPFLAHFFEGADSVDDLLTYFDYDECMEAIRNAGFKKTEKVWSTPSFTVDGITYPGARELLSNNGTELEAYIKTTCGDFVNLFPAGNGLGVKRPYLYKGYRADDPEILRDIIAKNYSGGQVISYITCDDGVNCHILDDTNSPYQGQEGMMLEFALSNRSCAFHGGTDFFIACEMLAAAKALGIYDWTVDVELKDKIKVGNNDYLYKVTHGWHSYAMRKETDIHINQVRVQFPDFAWAEKWWAEVKGE